MKTLILKTLVNDFGTALTDLATFLVATSERWAVEYPDRKFDLEVFAHYDESTDRLQFYTDATLSSDDDQDINRDDEDLWVASINPCIDSLYNYFYDDIDDVCSALGVRERDLYHEVQDFLTFKYDRTYDRDEIEFNDVWEFLENSPEYLSKLTRHFWQDYKGVAEDVMMLYAECSLNTLIDINE